MQDLTNFRGNFTYTIIEKTETGATSVSYLARVTETGQLVTIKTLDPQAGYRVTPRLRREARILSSLNSPHIVKVHDVGKERAGIFVVMDNVEGRPLMDWLHDQGQVSERTALRFMRQLAVAMKVYDEYSIVHQGLEPGSVYVCPDLAGKEEGMLKIRDFGLAAERDHARARLDELGSIAFLSPEQVDAGLYDIDVRTDIYSVGALIYLVLTKQAPYQGRSAGDLVRQISDLTTFPAPLAKMRADLSPQAVAIVNRCLEKSPNRRYQAPVDLMRAIDAVGVERDPLEYLYEKALLAQRHDDYAQVKDIWEAAQDLPGAQAEFQELLKWANRREVERNRSEAEALAAQARKWISAGQWQNASRAISKLEELPSQNETVTQLRSELVAQGGFRPAVLESDDTGAKYTLMQPEMHVGRASAKVQDSQLLESLVDLRSEPNGQTVSRDHASIVYDDGAWTVITNPNAHNRTLVDGVPVEPGESQSLNDGALLQFGGVKLKFKR